MNNAIKLMALTLTSFMLLGGSVLAYGDSTTISIGPSADYAKSGTIGSAYSADYEAYNSMLSSNDLWIEAHAQWVGWPFTLEQEHLMAPGDMVEFTENQDYNSNFYAVLNPLGAGGTGCYGYAGCALN